MQEREHILNELNEISAAVAAVPRINVFSVGSGYFSGIEREFYARLHADEARNGRTFPEVPAGYFEGLAGSVMARIRETETLSVTQETIGISPMIAAIGNRNLFAVPAGYFDNNIANAAWKPQAKVVSMFSPKKIVRFAAAAVFAGLIGIAIFFATRSESNTPDAQLASVMKSANEIIAKNSFDQTLNTVSEDDIAAYLASNGDDVNAAVAASYIDSADALPSAEDYMLDENLLRELLGEKTLNN